MARLSPFLSVGSSDVGMNWLVSSYVCLIYRYRSLRAVQYRDIERDIPM